MGFSEQNWVCCVNVISFADLGIQLLLRQVVLKKRCNAAVVNLISSSQKFRIFRLLSLLNIFRATLETHLVEKTWVFVHLDLCFCNFFRWTDCHHQTQGVIINKTNEYVYATTNKIIWIKIYSTCNETNIKPNIKMRWTYSSLLTQVTGRTMPRLTCEKEKKSWLVFGSFLGDLGCLVRNVSIRVCSIHLAHNKRYSNTMQQKFGENSIKFFVTHVIGIYIIDTGFDFASKSPKIMKKYSLFP